jgi:hypothetical protein
MDADRRWSSAAWEEATEESLRAGARMTMAERLAWLQEIRRLSDHIAARRGGREEPIDKGTLHQTGVQRPPA